MGEKALRWVNIKGAIVFSMTSRQNSNSITDNKNGSYIRKPNV